MRYFLTYDNFKACTESDEAAEQLLASNKWYEVTETEWEETPMPVPPAPEPSGESDTDVLNALLGVTVDG